MVFNDATSCLIYLLVKTIPVPVQQRIWKCKCNLEKPGTSEVFYLDDMTCSVFWNIYQHFYLTCKLKTKTNQNKKKWNEENDQYPETTSLLLHNSTTDNNKQNIRVDSLLMMFLNPCWLLQQQ